MSLWSHRTSNRCLAFDTFWAGTAFLFERIAKHKHCFACFIFQIFVVKTGHACLCFVFVIQYNHCNMISALPIRLELALEVAWSEKSNKKKIERESCVKKTVCSCLVQNRKIACLKRDYALQNCKYIYNMIEKVCWSSFLSKRTDCLVYLHVCPCFQLTSYVAFVKWNCALKNVVQHNR